MTSPVDTSVKFWHHSMANAPALSGTAGSLIALLDACLKDGFDSKSGVTVVVAGGVATVTFTGTHSSVIDSVILLSGVTGGPTNWADLNGEQKVVSRPSSTTVTFAAPTVANGTATGTVVMKMAPAGWLKPYSGTNLAAYQSGDVTSTKMFLRVDDTAAQAARVVGYETMSDVNNGTNPFPSAAQVSGGGYWVKSGLASAAATGWAIFADSKMFYLCVMPRLVSAANQMLGVQRGFGDIVAFRPGGDTYGCVLNAGSASGFDVMSDGGLGLGATATMSYFPRPHTGLGTSAAHTCAPYCGSNGTGFASGADPYLGAFPNPADGSLFMSKKVIATSVSNALGIMRGEPPGLIHIPQSLVVDTLKFHDRVPGSGAFAGRNFMAETVAVNSTSFNSGVSNTNCGVALFDITGPWR